MEKKAHERRLFVSEYQRLKFQTGNLEREIGMLSSKSPELKAVEDNKSSNPSTNHQKYKTAISQRMTRLRHRVKIFHDHLTKNKNQPDYVDKLRQHMMDVESCISDFKQQQQITLEKLLEEEQTISDDVTIVNKRLHTIMNSATPSGGGGKADGRAGVRVVEMMKESNLPPQIQQFQQFVNEYGRQGGWDDFDHSTFLRLRNKYKDREKLIKVTSDNLIGRSRDDVIQHEDWYQEYVRLDSEKKIAILQWRKNKQKELNTPREVEEDNSFEDELDEETKEKERIEREMKKQQIQEWKKLKVEHRQRIAEEKRLEDEKARKIKEKQQEQLAETRLQARLRLRERKEGKAREKFELQAQHEHMRAMKSEEAIREIQRFQIRDREELDRKLEEKRRKEEEEKFKKEKIEQSLKRNAEIAVDYDRSRLYQPTDAWLQRHRADITTPSSGGSSYVAHIAHRAVPSWRKGV